jgi:hypothetical protein
LGYNVEPAFINAINDGIITSKWFKTNL